MPAIAKLSPIAKPAPRAEPAGRALAPRWPPILPPVVGLPPPGDTLERPGSTLTHVPAVTMTRASGPAPTAPPVRRPRSESAALDDTERADDAVPVFIPVSNSISSSHGQALEAELSRDEQADISTKSSQPSDPAAHPSEAPSQSEDGGTRALPASPSSRWRSFRRTAISFAFVVMIFGGVQLMLGDAGLLRFVRARRSEAAPATARPAPADVFQRGTARASAPPSPRLASSSPPVEATALEASRETRRLGAATRATKAPKARAKRQTTNSETAPNIDQNGIGIPTE